ncbi:uncharacterized protein BDZ99DRAFT_484962 [Mytilinidion resinicola]|uniref:ceramidase n=1 Tax=Mytilinidion resinicola TaxID=574789 RepID=A0A6A6Z5K1_9PEZI|nr:uncharacterized protein BDZ99DRAFT_484962 [Mytilinidion resinicola]KAF2816310.1 hypothetical protein BDZ99DRAFT_484962 [Mytilinidion resinicola]
MPPIYTVDLSLPPQQRYAQVANDYKAVVSGLGLLFEEVIEQTHVPVALVKTVARLFLRRLYSKEQTEEIRGISKIVGVDMYLLVAYNTLLDCFMGCTSGGVQVKDGDETRMLHFRTLDWAMEELRKVIVQLEFVEHPGGEVMARSITYVGFVGILTGVRQDLSVSLNFRPYHNNDNSKLANLKFYTHLAFVLLGFRPSIASHLRDLILPKRPASPSKPPSSIKTEKSKADQTPLPDLATILSTLPSTPTTSAYLILSDGTTTAVMEKDRITATTRTSTSFITATNHDAAYEGKSGTHVAHAKHSAVGMQGLVDESLDRKGCVVASWKRAVRQYRQGRGKRRAPEDEVWITKEQLVDMVTDYPITNECTHYAAILDPQRGEVAWARCWETTAVPMYESSGAGSMVDVSDLEGDAEGEI